MRKAPLTLPFAMCCCLVTVGWEWSKGTLCFTIIRECWFGWLAWDMSLIFICDTWPKEWLWIPWGRNWDSFTVATWKRSGDNKGASSLVFREREAGGSCLHQEQLAFMKHHLSNRGVCLAPATENLIMEKLLQPLPFLFYSNFCFQKWSLECWQGGKKAVEMKIKARPSKEKVPHSPRP